MKTKLKKNAFTLIELLVVIAIIGLLASIVLVALNSARAKARDVFRKSSLKAIQAALELYYNDNNSYPVTGSSCCSWWGEVPGFGSHGYSGSNGYVPNLAPKYISQLPSDPRKGVQNVAGCGSESSGFLYTSDGVNYKALAHCTIESTVPSSDPFYDPVRPTWAYQVSSAGALNW